MTTMNDFKLVLASGSPRRRQLMLEAGYVFDVVVPGSDAECGICSGTAPPKVVAELAMRKAADVVAQLVAQGVPVTALVLAADTVAECDGQIFGKPANEQHARQILASLSGRRHRVLTGICLWPVVSPVETPADERLQPRVEVATTVLEMDRLEEAQLQEYVASGQWEGKAGAFGYQDRLGWVHIIEGSASNVVGLPMELLASMISEFEFLDTES